MAEIQTVTASNADKDVEEKKLSLIVGRNAKWYIHLTEEFGNSIQSSICNYYMF